jgi:hypothetical protein
MVAPRLELEVARQGQVDLGGLVDLLDVDGDPGLGVLFLDQLGEREELGVGAGRVRVRQLLASVRGRPLLGQRLGLGEVVAWVAELLGW